MATKSASKIDMGRPTTKSNDLQGHVRGIESSGSSIETDDLPKAAHDVDKDAKQQSRSKLLAKLLRERNGSGVAVQQNESRQNGSAETKKPVLEEPFISSADVDNIADSVKHGVSITSMSSSSIQDPDYPHESEMERRARLRVKLAKERKGLGL
jgi:hypothetical protein